MFRCNFGLDSFHSFDGTRLMFLCRSFRCVLLTEQFIPPDVVETNNFPNVLLQELGCRMRF